MSSYTILKSFLKKRTTLLFLLVSIFCFSGAMTSCSGPKTGCPMNEKPKNTNRKGELSKKGGKTNLFPKKVRKKMRS